MLGDNEKESGVFLTLFVIVHVTMFRRYKRTVLSWDGCCASMGLAAFIANGAGVRGRVFSGNHPVSGIDFSVVFALVGDRCVGFADMAGCEICNFGSNDGGCAWCGGCDSYIFECGCMFESA